MSNMFSGSAQFNEPIGSWDTSKVVNMSYMFKGAAAFDKAIDSWNTTIVNNMNNMFSGASKFNQPIGSWITSNVANMASMFQNASLFDRNINWHTSNVTDMNNMFSGASKFNQPFGAWITSNVTNMASMFQNASLFNQPIGLWNTTNVISMHSMFQGAAAFKQDIGSWNTSNVVTMEYMFNGATIFNQNLNKWIIFDVAIRRPTNFSHSSGLTTETEPIWYPIQKLDNGTIKYIGPSFESYRPKYMQTNPRGTMEWFAIVNDYHRSYVTQYSLFQTSGTDAFTPPYQSLVPFNNIVTTLMTNMNNMFSGSTQFNEPIGSWDISNVNDMQSMFQSAYDFNQDIGSWNTAKVVSMQYMFQNAASFNRNIGLWNTSNVTNMMNMFQSAIKFNQDIGSWNTYNVVNMNSMFYGAMDFTNNLRKWNIFKVSPNQPINFRTTSGLTNNTEPIWSPIISDGITIKYIGPSILKSPSFMKTNARNTGLEWFAVVDNSSKSAITNYANANNGSSASNAAFVPDGEPTPVSLNNIVTTLVTDMSRLFANTTFNGLIESWDTSRVTTMSNMFNLAVAFSKPIGSWNTSNVTTMDSMFQNAYEYDQAIGSWNTSNVTTMNSMFKNAFKFNRAIAFNPVNDSWNTSKVNTMAGMFYRAYKFNQDIGSWNTTTVNNMDSMFYYATDFNQNISQWNVNAVITYSSFKSDSILSDGNTPPKFLNPTTLSFTSNPITPIFYTNAISKTVTIPKPVSTNTAGAFTYTATVNRVALDAYDYSNTITVTPTTDPNQNCTLTIPSTNASFINNIILIAYQSATTSYREGSGQYPTSIDVINTSSSQVFLYSSGYNLSTVACVQNTRYIWMACLGAVESISSILGFSFQLFGGLKSVDQTFEVTVSVSNPSTDMMVSVTTEAKTTITFTLSSTTSDVDGAMTFIPFNPSLLTNTPSKVSNLVYSPSGLKTAISNNLPNSILATGCFVKIVLKKTTSGEATIVLSNNSIAGSLVVYKPKTNYSNLNSLTSTPNPNTLTYGPNLSLFSDSIVNMKNRLGVSNRSMMFYSVKINPIQFNVNPVVYPMNAKLQLNVRVLDSYVNGGNSLTVYSMTVMVVILIDTVLNSTSALTIPLNQPAPGSVGSYDTKDTYGYYVQTCSSNVDSSVIIYWGINGIGSGINGIGSVKYDDLYNENINYLQDGQSYPILNDTIICDINGGVTTFTNVTVNVSLSMSDNNGYGINFRPKIAGSPYCSVSLGGW